MTTPSVTVPTRAEPRAAAGKIGSRRHRFHPARYRRSHSEPGGFERGINRIQPNPTTPRAKSAPAAMSAADVGRSSASRPDPRTFHHYSAEAAMGIVRSDQKPIPGDGPFEEPLLRIHRAKRLDVERHRPGEWKMGHRRDDIARKACDLPGRGDQHRLVMRGVPGRHERRDARQNAGVPIQQLQPIRRGERLEVVGAISCPDPFIPAITGILQLS
jgi:hypothetical protein